MNWLESQREGMLVAAMERVGVSAQPDGSVPRDRRMLVREALIEALENSNVCSRDSIRIADAWTRGRKAPVDWRYA